MPALSFSAFKNGADETFHTIGDPAVNTVELQLVIAHGEKVPGN
jgi:hypothetical protein